MSYSFFSDVMEVSKLNYKLVIVVVMFSVAVFTEKAEKETSLQTCDFMVKDCDYILSLMPSNSCHGDKNDTKTRSRRSISVKNPTQTEFLGKKIKRVQNKLTRLIEQLSTRVLREVRQVETIVMELVAKQTKRGVANFRTCPSGFVTVDNWKACYMMSTFKTSWYEAKDYCNALDSHVVSLLTLKEHYIVTYLIRNNPDFKDTEGWWTSGTFYPKTKQWMWSSNTELRPLTYIKWAADEPNEASLQCIMLNSADEYLWHDEICTNQFNFVCKVDLQ